MRVALWIVQGVLAALFLFGGVVKLTMPLDELVAQAGLPGLFLQTAAVLEILGGLGLLLPGLLRIRTELTPLAAAGLTVMMLVASVLGMLIGDLVATLMPLSVGLLAAFVAYGRWRLAPLKPAATVKESVAAA
jgi:hypothetical protein